MTPAVCIVDLEATCDDQGAIRRHEQEVIEIAAIVQDANHEVLARFHTYVKPVNNPRLTDFCSSLTHVRQSYVDNAPVFVEAAREFKTFLRPFREQLVGWASWGEYDEQQFYRELRFTGAPDPFGVPYHNLKRILQAKMGGGKKLGAGEAVQHFGLDWEGARHSARDDVHNIARATAKFLDLRRDLTTPPRDLSAGTSFSL